jgi:hypothetical protein
MKIIDLEKNKQVTRKYVRDLFLEFETDDILDNWGDFKDGHLDIVSKCDKLKKINTMEIEQVIYELNTFWACEFEIINS